MVYIFMTHDVQKYPSFTASRRSPLRTKANRLASSRLGANTSSPMLSQSGSCTKTLKDLSMLISLAHLALRLPPYMNILQYHKANKAHCLKQGLPAPPLQTGRAVLAALIQHCSVALPLPQGLLCVRLVCLVFAVCRSFFRSQCICCYIFSTQAT